MHKQAANNPETEQILPTSLQKASERKRAQVNREQRTQRAQTGSLTSLLEGQEVLSHLLEAGERSPPSVSPLALLIDGENISPQDANEILTYAQSYGAVRIRRLYGNFATAAMTRWREAGWQHGLTPIHHAPPIAGKNGCDIALVVDAMQLCEEGIRSFVLVSSDSDYIPLVRRLRERGCVIIGMGKKETHVAFKQVCSHFVELAGKGAGTSPEKGALAGSRDECESMQGGSQEQTVSRSLEYRPLSAYREASTQTQEEWISLSLLSKYLLSGMGEQEEREGLIALLENMPVLFAWKLGKGGTPLLRERGQEAEKATSLPKRR